MPPKKATRPRPKAPSPSPADEAASSAESAPDSPTSSGGVIGDAGPEFDPEAAAGQPQVLQPDEVLEPEQLWDPDTIESILRLKGRALHSVIGVAEEDWLYTELDLQAIAPPLQRILNRYEPTRALAKHADPLVVGVAFLGYGVRSLEERAAVLRELADDGLEPIEPLPPEEDGVPINAAPPAPPAPVPAVDPRQVAPPPPVPQADVNAEEMNWEVER